LKTNAVVALEAFLPLCAARFGNRSVLPVSFLKAEHFTFRRDDKSPAEAGEETHAAHHSIISDGGHPTYAP
jgi:hypothetical protein